VVSKLQAMVGSGAGAALLSSSLPPQAASTAETASIASNGRDNAASVFIASPWAPGLLRERRRAAGERTV
jgi:hypothetical protein